MNVILLTWCQWASEIFLKTNRKHVSKGGITVKGRQWGQTAWCPSVTLRGTWTSRGAASQGTNLFAFPNDPHSKPKQSYFNFWLPAQGLLKMYQWHKEGLDMGLETRYFDMIIPMPSPISAMPGMLHPQPQCPHLSWESLWQCAELLGGAHCHCKVWLYTIVILKRIERPAAPLWSLLPWLLSPGAAEKEDAVGACAAMTCRDERDALHCEERGVNKLQALYALHFMCLGGAQQGGSHCPLCAHFHCPAWHLH